VTNPGRREIQEQLTSIFRDLFDDDSIEISDKTTADDIEGWDSLTHIDLIVATERAFKVSFTTKDVKGMRNVGEFLDMIEKRVAH
jgi:acyl carrier protein